MKMYTFFQRFQPEMQYSLYPNAIGRYSRNEQILAQTAKMCYFCIESRHNPRAQFPFFAW